MRGSREIASAPELTPGPVLVTWLQEGAELMQLLICEELCGSLPQAQLLWDLCGPDLEGALSFLQAGPFSDRPHQSLKHWTP